MRYLITGASGEIGSDLILSILSNSDARILAVDRKDSLHPSLLSELDEKRLSDRVEFLSDDLTKAGEVRNLLTDYQPGVVFHLAAMLSTAVEKQPEESHNINVEVPRQFIQAILSLKPETPTKLIFPSSIAVYGLSGVDVADLIEVGETEYPEPISLYGIQKRFIEQIGSYFCHRFPSALDFRSLRFPGLLSSKTLPTGGTSDYASEMIHAAAQGKHYVCFSEEESTLPFMVMSDAVQALIGLSESPSARLTRRVYNVSGFAFAARDLAQALLRRFPGFSVSFEPNPTRVGIIQSWPRRVNDAAARRDWSFSPTFDFEDALDDYLIPDVVRRYNS